MTLAKKRMEFRLPEQLEEFERERATGLYESTLFAEGDQNSCEIRGVLVDRKLINPSWTGIRFISEMLHAGL